MAIESLLNDRLDLQMKQKVLCPHCLKRLRLSEELQSLIENLSPNEMSSMCANDGTIPLNFIPPSTIQNRLISSSNPELYFDLDAIKPVMMFDSVFVECSSGFMVDILDVIPEYFIPKNLEIQNSFVHFGDRIAKGIDTEIHRGWYIPRCQTVESFYDSTTCKDDNLKPNVVIKKSCHETSKMSTMSSEFGKDPVVLQSSDRSLYREMQILLRLKHKYIVELRGVVTRPLGLVIEYMEGGSLLEYLRHCRDGSGGREERDATQISDESVDGNTTQTGRPAAGPLEGVCGLPCWREKMKIACEIAEAMAFLHSNMFIHRDLKSPNILLTRSPGCEYFTAKVSDFGTCASLEFTNVLRRCRVDNPRWLPPEIISRSVYTTKADVYAFGNSVTHFRNPLMNILIDTFYQESYCGSC
jgi:hypothetical protein